MKKSKTRKFMSAAEYYSINELYWDGEIQDQLAQENKCSQPHISRIASGERQPRQATLFKKEQLLNKAIKPSKNESQQSKTLKAKRDKLQASKLTWKKAQEIRKLYFSGDYIQLELAKKYGVNQCSISRIITGKKWKATK